MAYIVSLKQFDGPLDLLLTLISKAKIDIKDIFISQITEQYLEYMSLVDELDVEAASEFLQMAALLVEIKSRALLPKPPKPENEQEETPEQLLIRRLTEYKEFKEKCEDMKRLEEAAAMMLSKLPEEYPLPPQKYELTGLTLEGLIKAYRKVLEKTEDKDKKQPGREIHRDSYTVASCMGRLQARLKRGSVTFDKLFTSAPERSEVVCMLMAVLELLRLNRLKLRQDGIFGEIYLEQVVRNTIQKDEQN